MRRRRTLSAEEKRLWGEVARSARPLPGRTAPEAPAPAAPQNAPAEPPGLPGSVASLAVKAASGTGRANGAALVLHPIERPVRRKLGRGRIAIEDRIDLHGRTEAAAHLILLGFLRRAQGQGLRHVLVITGRGASFGSMGVLKRAFPHWLATPEFRALVAGYEPAERNHGGDGAFYVRMRRARATP